MMMTLISVEFNKLKRSKILYIVLGTMFLFFLCAAAQGIKTGYSAKRLMSETLMYANYMITPALLSLLGSYMISREYYDDTMKSLLVVPVKKDKLFKSKLIASCIIGVLIYLFLFILTLITSAIIHSGQITFIFFLMELKNYLLQGLGCFLAILPLILGMSIIKNGYWLSLIFGEMYSFTGLIAASSEKYRNIYPISAVFGFSGVNTVTLTQYLTCCLSLGCCVLLAIMILKFKRDL